jgi:translation initiation factor 2B subunit (eIF-2B alpha/beta/delta family)
VLLLNTGFEAVGRYAPIDIQDINIYRKRKSRAAAMVEVVKHLESVSQWKAVDDLREQEKRERNLSSTAEPKRKIYDN